MEEASSSMLTSITTAKSTFSALSSSYEDLQESLRDQINEIQEQVDSQISQFAHLMNEQVLNLDHHAAKLLDEFAKRSRAHIEDRMNEWVNQTRTFFQNLSGTIEALGEVIDEIDSRRRPIR